MRLVEEFGSQVCILPCVHACLCGLVDVFSLCRCCMVGGSAERDVLASSLASCHRMVASWRKVSAPRHTRCPATLLASLHSCLTSVMCVRPGRPALLLQRRKRQLKAREAGKVEARHVSAGQAVLGMLASAGQSAPETKVCVCVCVCACVFTFCLRLLLLRVGRACTSSPLLNPFLRQVDWVCPRVCFQVVYLHQAYQPLCFCNGSPCCQSLLLAILPRTYKAVFAFAHLTLLTPHLLACCRTSSSSPHWLTATSRHTTQRRPPPARHTATRNSYRWRYGTRWKSPSCSLPRTSLSIGPRCAASAR